ncbi:hypothetical protein [Flavobacterium yafengii]|uniref:hypothetical protein n=1 Tax=Flavobacterium yafengii TaxID=3041253 RepID=UPI0024A89BC9|nr:hypothetical protein [Flavobacterium yafengii]MDI5899444.1 hypothetical protein [Flavobacterium yafengii]
MKLDQLYSLRKNFTIIGLTGKVGAGTSKIAEILSSKDYINKINIEDFNLNQNKPEDLKIKICYNYLNDNENWRNFTVIEYKSVLLLHLLFQCVYATKNTNSIEDAIKMAFEIIGQNGESGKFRDIYINRFDIKEDYQLLGNYLYNNTKWFDEISKIDFDKYDTLNKYLKANKTERKIYLLFYANFSKFSEGFYDVLNKLNFTKRTRLLHDLANNLRLYGNVINIESGDKNLKHIYTVAETINYLIKLWKSNNTRDTKIIIDSLKNSLELMYFKEKFSAFYMVAVNKSEDERKSYISDKLLKILGTDTDNKHFKETLKLGDSEYDGTDFSKGEFAYPDIENCIQKSEYHLFFSEKDKKFDINRQLIKFISLIHQPGIITPSGIERCMQVAYNAKLNSGCISRQVGAVVTDANFSIKSIGWNDVAEHQLPCNLRSVEDLINNENPNHFSDYEKEGGKFKKGEETLTFKELISIDFEELKNKEKELGGRTCSFCFKSHLNTYEGEKNQVHTRSLHAEENAMMQVVKNGGLGLKGGNLFTTASPCELCSKKAFQLGIKNIFYIDPYPGIATKHILKSGIDSKENPELLMFQGAVGKTFHKLYDPFMPYKDELAILTEIKPKIPQSVKNKKLKNILTDKIKDKDLKKKLEEIFNDENTAFENIIDLLKKGVEDKM